MQVGRFLYQIIFMDIYSNFLPVCAGQWISSSVSYDLVKNISRQLQWANGFGYGLVDIEPFVISTFYDLPIHDCVWHCIARPRCAGFEYRTQLKYCKLISNYTTTEKRPGYIGVTGFENLVSKPCGALTCSINETCEVSILTGQLTCQISDCGYPPTTEYVLGNRYTVESQLYHHHDTRLRHLSCADNGQWQFGQVSNYPGVTCGDIRKYRSDIISGVYKNRFGLEIYCEFSADESWLVFQRRQDGSVNFVRLWNEYKNGFGDLNGEFWLGLEHIYNILQSKGDSFSLQIDMERWDGARETVTYSQFSITDETDKYRLSVSGFNGTQNLEDALSVHNGMMFSTQDQDNDGVQGGSCAESYPGGWWYKACVFGTLNGIYYTDTQFANINPPGSGIIWKTWVDSYASLKSTTMKMRNNLNTR